MRKPTCDRANRMRWLGAASCLILICLAGCEQPPVVTSNAEPAPSSAVADVNTNRVLSADSEPQNWLVHGRTYDEQRYSPLTQINEDNIAGLGLAWFYDFPTKRGIEATPIVVDGVMYVTGSWSRVYALDAKTGALLWEYD